MAELNEAYRVLRHPVRRAVYDAELHRSRQRPPTSGRSPTPPAKAPLRRVVRDDRPARFPWKLVGAMAGLGIFVVLVGAALSRPSPPEQPDNVLQRGSCVAIEPNGDAREVTCTDTVGDLVVRELVPFDGACRAGLEPHRDRQGMGTACVEQRR